MCPYRSLLSADMFSNHRLNGHNSHVLKLRLFSPGLHLFTDRKTKSSFVQITQAASKIDEGACGAVWAFFPRL